MNYIRQLFYDMRHHKMMTWVSVGGTAVSIFLVLIFFMVNSLPTVEAAPETKRSRIYGARKMFVEITDGERQGWSANGGFTYESASQLYGNLDGVELVSYKTWITLPVNIHVSGKSPVLSYGLKVDGNFWKMYDFGFINGHPFTEEQTRNTSDVPVVITERLARKLFNTEDATGESMTINGTKYYVAGVVKGSSPIFRNTWAEIYLPLDKVACKPIFREEEYISIGELNVMLLYGEDTDPAKVEQQVKSRIATLNSGLAKIGAKAHPDEIEAPAELGKTKNYSNPRYLREIASNDYLVYALLLLLPAINLSSMMRGRMLHRISEIGVRRAFGARRSDILNQLLGENFIVTLLGGIIGLVLSYIFMMYFSASFVAMTDYWLINNLEVKMSTPNFDMLFSWRSFVLALGACLILNILTASLPAWKAASVEPSVAINKSKI